MNTNNMKRMRGRNNRGGGMGGGGGGPVRHQSGNVPLNRNHVFDSQGPDLRVRGTSQQLFEKYLQLGRDSTSNNDRVMAEAYFQHAEHYFRIINAMNQAAQAQQGGAQQGGAQQGGAQQGGAQQGGSHQGPQHGGVQQGGAPHANGHNGPRREEDEDDHPAVNDQPVESREIPIEAAAPDM